MQLAYLAVQVVDDRLRIGRFLVAPIEQVLGVLGRVQGLLSALTIAQWHFRYLIPWSAINATSIASFHGQPLVLIGLHDPSTLVADPPIR